MAFLVVLFIVVPVVELYVIIQIGQLIGLWPTLALLLADALLGSLLLRHQGRGAWRRFNEAIAARRFPGKEVADGLLIAIGGTLLLTPGFLTDIVGAIFLIPPTRALVRRLLRGWATRRFVVVGGPAGAAYGAARGAPKRGRPRLRLRGNGRGDRRGRPAAPGLACDQAFGCLGWWMSTLRTVISGVKPSEEQCFPSLVIFPCTPTLLPAAGDCESTPWWKLTLAAVSV
jgi:UPF0716 protein FxsA